jgi:hypothetical protein
MRNSRTPIATERDDLADGHQTLPKGPTLQNALFELRDLLGSLAELTSAEATEILGLLRTIELTLLARQIQSLMPARPTTAADPEDRWLTPDEVAARLKRTRAWVYRQAQRWSFAKRPSRKTLLISERSLTRWLERR